MERQNQCSARPSQSDRPSRPRRYCIRSPQVVHNPERDRFELWVAGDLVGVLGYSSEVVDGKPTISVMHTVIYDEYTGPAWGTTGPGSAGLRQTLRCAIAARLQLHQTLRRRPSRHRRAGTGLILFWPQ